MPALPLVIAALILILGALYRQRLIPQPPPKAPEALAETTPQSNPTPKSTPTPTITSPPTPTSAPSPMTEETPSNFSGLIYPGAVVNSTSGTAVQLESTDSVDAITEWYKTLIKNRGLNTKSFVQTKTNGNLHSVLVGASKDEEIRVIITQNAGTAQVHIEASIKIY